MSPRSIRAIIDHWLAVSPLHPSPVFDLFRHLIFDATFLFQRKGIVCLMTTAPHRIIAGRYGVSEHSLSQLYDFLLPLKQQGLNPVSVTLDGNPHVIRAITTLWPSTLIQRCLVHIQRQGLMWCRINPKRTDAKILRRLFLLVTSITTPEQHILFLTRLHQWEQRYGHQIATTPQHGWVASDLKRARSMLLNALPNMFHYLSHPNIPISTNGLEGYFARLKQHYRQHRGLAPHKRSQYFSWYFSMRPK